MKKYIFLSIPLILFAAAQARADGRKVWTKTGVAVSTANSTQQYPAIVTDDSGGAIICWQDNRSANYDIYAQKVNEDGETQWTRNGIPAASLSDQQQRPVICKDGSGGAIIAWWDNRDGSYDVYAQRLESDGTASWTTNGVAVSTYPNIPGTSITSDIYDLDISSDGAGGAIIAWVDERNGNRDIFTQRLNSSGEAQWGAGGLAVSTNTSYQDSVELVSDGTGGAVLAWHDYRNGNWDIYAAHVSSGGTKDWSDLHVFSNSNGDKSGFTPDADMASDGAGGAIVVWQQRDSSQTYDIYAQRILSGGTLGYGGSNNPVCTAADFQLEPKVAGSTETGTCIVTWRDFRVESFDNYTTAYGDIYALRLEADGSRDSDWTADGVEIAARPDKQKFIKIIPSVTGGAIITWQDNRGGDFDIYVEKISNSGESEWGAQYYGTAVSTEVSNQQYPAIVDDGINGAIICWQDDRSHGDPSYSDIYIQRVTDPDSIDPETISTLSALTGTGSDEMELSWIAPHEDGSTGTAAHHYILKYSTQSISTASFWWENTAGTYPQSWTPAEPGIQEQKSVYLLGGNTYYFLIIAVDDANNKSTIDKDNSDSAWALYDTDPPSRVTEISAQTGTSEGKVNLTWTSPYDNSSSTGNFRILSGNYFVQYSSDTSVTWSTTTANTSIELQNHYADESQALAVTGLEAGATYYFRIWTEDEVPNLSAISFGATTWAQVDITEPGTSTITAWQISGASTSVKLTWNASGDDGFVNYNGGGFSGGYRILYSSTGISSPSSGDAQVDISTSGVNPGDAQAATVTGLLADTDYSFVLWTYDEAGNISSYSNTGSTKTYDMTPPGQITDLAGQPATFEARIDLSWSAPGDNEYTGTADHYEIRATTDTPFSWNTANVIRQEIPVGGIAGTSESYTLTGLINGATYYIKVRSYDEQPNEQTLCNEATAWAQIDDVAPQAVTLIPSPGDAKVTLSWTAPGDNYGTDVLNGTCEIKLSTVSAIDSVSGWNSISTTTAGYPYYIKFSTSGVSPGTSVSRTITGLTNYVKYWFALRTSDEKPNQSGLSNSPAALPTPDLIAPSAQLTYSPPEKIYVLGNKLTVKVQASDAGTGVKAIYLYYRKTGTSSYNTVTVYSNSAGISSAPESTGDIPAAAVTAAGIDYYVEALDRAENWWLSTGQTGSQTQSEPSVTPHTVKYYETFSATVTADAATVELPDGNADDGSTAVIFKEGSFDQSISIGIKQGSVSQAEPLDGLLPVNVYDFTPDGKLFKKPASVRLLYFDLDNDGLVDSTGDDETKLKIFHWDGFKWRYMGGTVNAEENTVTADTSHFSLYALFCGAPVPGPEDTAPLRKIITPNDDGINDFAEFSGLNPPFTLKIYNLRGRCIREIDEGSNPSWDGRDDDGDLLESGPYIYQLEKDGDTVTGIIVIAK